MVRNLFLTTCATCHGSDARGMPGFPDLGDEAWLYGGEPEMVLTSILNGRAGMMPALGPALGTDGITEVVAHVTIISGGQADAELAAAGAARFAMLCAACHGPTGGGNQMLGAPDLTDGNWLYGGDPETLATSIESGRNGQMPAHRPILGEDRARLIAAYVLSLSNDVD